MNVETAAVGLHPEAGPDSLMKGNVAGLFGPHNRPETPPKSLGGSETVSGESSREVGKHPHEGVYCHTEVEALL